MRKNHGGRRGAAPVPLETARLRLVPFTPGDILAIIEGVAPFEARTGMRAGDGLRDFYVSGDVSPAWLDQLRAAPDAADPWRHGFAVVERDGATVVATAGFKGPPDEDGAAEIAYGVVPGRQGRGYATEAAAALVAFALADRRVRLVRAHTLPEPNASTRVLAKCGFGKVGEVVDPEDGPVWRWELGREGRAEVAS